LSRVYVGNVAISYNRSNGTGLKRLLVETYIERGKLIEQNERQRSNEDQVRILTDNVLLTIRMNASMLSVQLIHNHMGKYVSIPDSWRSKKYAFEFVQVINEVVVKNILTELRAASFHTLIVDGITVHKMLILYFKFRPVNSVFYKTVFSGITQLTVSDALALETGVTALH
jgi:hypothetical protein